GATESRRRTASLAARREPAAQSPGAGAPAAKERTGAEKRTDGAAGRRAALAEGAVLRTLDSEGRSGRGQSRSADAVQRSGSSSSHRGGRSGTRGTYFPG